MSHPRTAIREYVVQTLGSAGAAQTEGRRAHPLPEATTSHVTARVTADAVLAKHADAPLALKRQLTLEVEVVTQGASCEDDADTITAAVEDLLMADHTLGGTCSECVLESTELELDSAETRKAMAVLTFGVVYFTEHTNTAVEAFATAGVTWDMGPAPDGQAEASDTLSLPQ